MMMDAECHLGREKTVTVTPSGWTFVGVKEHTKNKWGRIRGKGVSMSSQVFVTLMDKIASVTQKKNSMANMGASANMFDFHICGRLYVRLIPGLNGFLLCKMYMNRSRMYRRTYQSCYLKASQWEILAANGHTLIKGNVILAAEKPCYQQQLAIQQKELHFTNCTNCNPWGDESLATTFINDYSNGIVEKEQKEKEEEQEAYMAEPVFLLTAGTTVFNGGFRILDWMPCRIIGRSTLSRSALQKRMSKPRREKLRNYAEL